MDNYLELYKNMIPNSIKLSYKGTVTFELIDSILQIISNRLDVIEGNINIRRRVYSVLMECLQNLSLHIEEHKEEEELEYDCKSAILTIENVVDSYIISTGNFIQNKKIPVLKDWLDQINNSSIEELKLLYNRILTNNTYNTKGGGGLGFVDIARKINGKLDYQFEQIDENFSFFQLEVQIKKSN
jgi:hypothetical protein